MCPFINDALSGETFACHVHRTVVNGPNTPTTHAAQRMRACRWGRQVRKAHSRDVRTSDSSAAQSPAAAHHIPYEILSAPNGNQVYLKMLVKPLLFTVVKALRRDAV